MYSPSLSLTTPRVPHPLRRARSFFLRSEQRVGLDDDASSRKPATMNNHAERLARFHHNGDWHFITCSCYRRQKFLHSVRRRDLSLEILEQVRAGGRWPILPACLLSSLLSRCPSLAQKQQLTAELSGEKVIDAYEQLRLGNSRSRRADSVGFQLAIK